MAKKQRPRTGTPAELVAVLPPADPWYGPGILSPAGRAEFVDDEGRRWRKVRGPLHRNLAKRLAGRADEMIVGEGAGGRFRHVAPADRLAVWHELKDRLDADEPPTYAPYEFVSGDGLTLLYVEESC